MRLETIPAVEFDLFLGEQPLDRLAGIPEANGVYVVSCPGARFSPTVGEFNRTNDMDSLQAVTALFIKGISGNELAERWTAAGIMSEGDPTDRNVPPLWLKHLDKQALERLPWSAGDRDWEKMAGDNLHHESRSLKLFSTLGDGRSLNPQQASLKGSGGDVSISSDARAAIVASLLKRARDQFSTTFKDIGSDKFDKIAASQSVQKMNELFQKEVPEFARKSRVLAPDWPNDSDSEGFYLPDSIRTPLNLIVELRSLRPSPWAGEFFWQVELEKIRKRIDLPVKTVTPKQALKPLRRR